MGFTWKEQGVRPQSQSLSLVSRSLLQQNPTPNNLMRVQLQCLANSAFQFLFSCSSASSSEEQRKNTSSQPTKLQTACLEHLRTSFNFPNKNTRLDNSPRRRTTQGTDSTLYSLFLSLPPTMPSTVGWLAG